MEILRISARKSDLARIQAYEVAREIRKNYPKVKIQFLFKESLGDQNQNDPLWKMPEKGVFTSDFKVDLVEGRTDLVVHSWKDLPIESALGTHIIATLKRSDPRDLLLLKKKPPLANSTLKFYTSSPRREFCLKKNFEKLFSKLESPKTLEFAPVRGNILTRVKKFSQDAEVFGLFVAKAAIDRILAASAWTDKNSTPNMDSFEGPKNEILKLLREFEVHILPLEWFPTAAAQGALAIEVADNRPEIHEICKNLNVSDDFSRVLLERKILSEIGGGCHEKAGISVEGTEANRRIFFVAEKFHPKYSSSPVNYDFSESSKAAQVLKNFSNAELWPSTEKSSDSEIVIRQPLKKEVIEAHYRKIKSEHSLEPSKILWIPAHPTTLGICQEIPEILNDLKQGQFWAPGEKTYLEASKMGLKGLGHSSSLGILSENWNGILKLSGLQKIIHLSHGDSQNPLFINLPLYELRPKNLKEIQEQFKGKKVFFWKSPSKVKIAQECGLDLTNPQFFHFCGAGKTLEFLKGKVSEDRLEFLPGGESQWTDLKKHSKDKGSSQI